MALPGVELEDGGKVSLPGDAAGSDGQSVMMGVRPEHLGLAANNAGIPVIMVPDVIPAGEFEREHTVAVLDDLVCVKNYIEKENK